MPLKGLELEIESDVGDVVERTSGQVEPHQLVAGGILIAHSADVCSGRNLQNSLYKRSVTPQ